MWEQTTINELNKLFCTFAELETVDETVRLITKRYTILYNKIFILESPQSNELICTYNIDMGNISTAPMVNTILVHRKKETNTLYTINALNALIRRLNGGILDTSYRINWNEHKNSILLTHESSDVRKLDTKVHKIVDFLKETLKRFLESISHFRIFILIKQI
jgi:hypothetical protein